MKAIAANGRRYGYRPDWRAVRNAKGMIMNPQEAVSSLHEEKLGGSGGAGRKTCGRGRGDTFACALRPGGGGRWILLSDYGSAHPLPASGLFTKTMRGRKVPACWSELTTAA